MKRLDNRGITIIELLIVTSIGALILLAIAMMVGRAFGLPRFQIEHGTITTNGRVAMKKIADDIRLNGVSDIGWHSITTGSGSYSLDGDKIMKSGQVLMRKVKKLDFEYWSIGGSKAVRLDPNSPNIDLSVLARVRMHIQVDVDENQLPEDIFLDTEVAVR